MSIISVLQPLKLLKMTVIITATVMVSLPLSPNTPLADIPVTKITAPHTGVKAWLVTETANPIIAITMMFKGGANLEPDDKRGMTRLMSYLLDEGADDLDALTFQKKLQDYAIGLRTTAQRDYVQISFKTLTEHQDIAFDLLKKALTKPHFNEDAIERMRKQMLVDLKRAQSNPQTLLDDAWRDQVFAGHIYQRKLRGRKTDLTQINTKHLKAYHQLLFTTSSVSIGITGDITTDQAQKRLDDLFQAMPSTRQHQIDIPFKRPILTANLSIINKDFPQSRAVFTQNGPNRKDQDFFPAYLVNHILGGSQFTSQLAQEVREKKGLAYSVSSYLNPMQFSATWKGSVATQADRMPESVHLIRTIWENMHKNGPTHQELEDAKTYLIGSDALRFTSNSAIAQRLAAYQYQNLTLNDFHNRNKFIEDVTLAQAQDVAKKWLTPDTLSFIIIGKSWQQ